VSGRTPTAKAASSAAPSSTTLTTWNVPNTSTSSPAASSGPATNSTTPANPPPVSVRSLRSSSTHNPDAAASALDLSDIAIKPRVCVHHFRHVEIRLHPFSRSAAELSCERGVEQQLLRKLRKRHAIADRDEKTRFAMRNKFAIGRNIARHDRHARRHRLHQTVRLPLEITRQPEHIERREQPRHVIPRSEKPHAVFHTYLPRELLERRTLRSVAGDQEHDVALQHADEFKRPDQVLDPFLPR